MNDQTSPDRGPGAGLPLLAVGGFLVVALVVLLGIGMLRGRSRSTPISLAQPNSILLTQYNQGTLRLQLFTTTNSAAAVENGYLGRFGIANMRMGVTHQSGRFAKTETTGAVDMRSDSNSVLAVTRLTPETGSIALIEPNTQLGLMQVISLQKKFDPTASSIPVSELEVPKYPGVDGPYGASSPCYRGHAFETGDSVESVAQFYRTILSEWQFHSTTGLVGEGVLLVASREHRLFLLRALQSTNPPSTKAIVVVGGR